MAQLMPLTLTVSCLSKIQIGFTFLVWYRLTQVVRDKGLLNGCLCVCVCVCVCVHSASVLLLPWSADENAHVVASVSAQPEWARTRKAEQFWIFWGKEILVIRMAVASAQPILQTVCTLLQTDNYNSVFTGCMVFLMPSQQCQSTESTVACWWIRCNVAADWCGQVQCRVVPRFVSHQPQVLVMSRPTLVHWC